MNYKFAAPQSDPNRIVLVRARMLQIVLGLFLFVVAIAVLPGGLLLFLSEQEPYVPFFFTGIGLLFLSAGIAVSTMLAMPNSLVFDNVTGALIVREGRGAKASTAELPYPEIDTFQVRRHRQGKSYSYVVEMLKTDGAFWTLFSSGSATKAEAFRDRLLERVILRGTTAAGEPPAPAWVTVDDRGDSAVIEWRTRYSAGRRIMTIMLMAAMAMTIYGSRPYAASGAAYYIALAFMACILLAALVSALNSIGRSNRVEIDGRSLSYRKTGGIFSTGEFTLPAGEIEAIMFNFSVFSGETAIYVLTGAEKDAIQNIKRGAIEPADIFTAISVIKKAGKLDVGSLSIGDRLALERIIQKTMERKAGASRRAL